MTKPVFLPLVGACAILAFATAGCGSGATQRDLMMDEAQSNATTERPVAMRGEATFLDGKIAALATVSRGFERSGHRGPGGKKRGADEGEYGKRKGQDAFGEVYNVGFGDSEEEQKEAMEEYIRQAKARRAAGSPMPPVTLKVYLENKGTEPLDVEVTEVNSDLGNFAVRPPKLTIPPGGRGELEPMISQLGVTADEFPLKLEVRVGGKKELQVVDIKNVILASVRK